MNIAGIIVEYNPFHSGHRYHIEKTRALTQCDLLIAVMSGNFVQRGEPAITDKWHRAKTAVENGVDLVIELPYVFAVESADYFSKGALQILHAAGVKQIVFGSESFNETALHQAFVLSQSQAYQDAVNHYLASGASYPASLNQAFQAVGGIEIKNPNDLLGLSYAREIYQNHYPIKIRTIARTQPYHDLGLQQPFASASALRQAIKDQQDISFYSPMVISHPHLMESYFDLLQYLLLTTPPSKLQTIHTMTEGLENRLQEAMQKATDMDDFFKRVQTRRYTRPRLSRTLIHLLMSDQLPSRMDLDVGYLRLLACNQKGKDYLRTLKKTSPLPLVGNYSVLQHPHLEMEMQAARLYALSAPAMQRATIIRDEYTHPFLFLP